MSAELEIRKTYKLYVGGEFVRALTRGRAKSIRWQGCESAGRPRKREFKGSVVR